jgi:hypothetical protein
MFFFGTILIIIGCFHNSLFDALETSCIVQNRRSAQQKVDVADRKEQPGIKRLIILHILIAPVTRALTRLLPVFDILKKPASGFTKKPASGFTNKRSQNVSLIFGRTKIQRNRAYSDSETCLLRRGERKFLVELWDSLCAQWGGHGYIYSQHACFFV